MNRNQSILAAVVILMGVLLAACGAPSATDTPEADRVATRVAEELAVAATLTAAAPSDEGSPPPTEAAPAATIQPPTVTVTPSSSPTQAPAADTAAPTDTAPPEATATPPPAPTDTPPPAPTDTPPPPTPTPTPILIAVLPVDGGGGDVPRIRNNNPEKGGRNVTLPGYTPDQVTTPMVFRDQIVFRAEVFDDQVGTNDGDGIENVTFSIFDSYGNLVHERTENNAGYCAFGGGEPDCEVWSFAEYNFQWPDGAPVGPGLHNVEIDINPEDEELANVTWLWSFEIDLPQTTSARIDNIYVQDSRYVVEFETTGFEPQLPGQHVHFFFDTVPPEQAGVPGSGPWILYGGPSPFTEYGVADRPADAGQMCILVANPDHSVQGNSGNCVDLPQ